MSHSFVKMTEEEFRARLKEMSPRPIRIQFHEKRSSYVASRMGRDGTIDLSLHCLFLFASTPVLQALIRFALNRDAQAKAIIRQMAHIYITQIAPPVSNNVLPSPTGNVFDLKVIYDRVNKDFFDSTVEVSITWFAIPHYSRFRRITFGNFDRSLSLIKINRILDDHFVPLSFVEFIVYHEMLHRVCDIELASSGRFKVHTAEFRRREALHPYFVFAKEWEKKSMKIFKDKYVRTQ